MTNYAIQCGAECADDCQALERGVFETTDEAGDRFIVAAHDTHPVQDADGRDRYGAWWQVFEEPILAGIK